MAAAPSFAVDTGVAIVGQVGTAITPITVPEATGDPIPTYATAYTTADRFGFEGAGSGWDRVPFHSRQSNPLLPAGLTFDAATRVISGTPTDVISSTITIRATNSVGTADWKVSYRFMDPSPPVFADDTGDAISGTVGTAIANVTVPEADGFPAPTYSASGLPGGLSFNQTTRVLSGTPSAAGSGAITVTATNSEGSADWTVAYTFVLAALVLSDFATPAGSDMRVLALIETGTLNGNEVFDTNDNRGALLDGDNVIENVNGSGASITVGRFQVDSGGGRITLNRRGGSGNFRDGFGGEAGEVYAEATVYLQFVNGTVITLTNTEQNSPGGGFLSYSTPAFPAAWQIAAHTLRTSGTRFILGIGIPEPVGVDHTADAGSASWAFAAPEPSITYTPALTLADRVIPSGHNTVFAALIHAQVSSLNVFGATLDGDTRLTSDLTIASGAPLVFSVQFFRGGSGNFANLFGAGRALREASFHIQTTATDLNSVDIDNIPSSDVEADAFYVSRTIPAGRGSATASPASLPGTCSSCR